MNTPINFDKQQISVIPTSIKTRWDRFSKDIEKDIPKKRRMNETLSLRKNQRFGSLNSLRDNESEEKGLGQVELDEWLKKPNFVVSENKEDIYSSIDTLVGLISHYKDNASLKRKVNELNFVIPLMSILEKENNTAIQHRIIYILNVIDEPERITSLGFLTQASFLIKSPSNDVVSIVGLTVGAIARENRGLRNICVRSGISKLIIGIVGDNAREEMVRRSCLKGLAHLCRWSCYDESVRETVEIKTMEKISQEMKTELKNEDSRMEKDVIDVNKAESSNQLIDSDNQKEELDRLAKGEIELCESVKMLCTLIESEDLEVLRFSLIALSNITTYNTIAAFLVTQNKKLKRINRLLLREDVSVILNSLIIVDNLVFWSDIAMQLVIDSGSVIVLKHLLESDIEEVAMTAAHCLSNIATGSATQCEELFNEGIMQLLQKRIFDSGRRCKVEIAHIYRSVAEKKESRKRMIAGGYVETLCEVLRRSGDGTVLELTLETLIILVEGEEEEKRLRLEEKRKRWMEEEMGNEGISMPESSKMIEETSFEGKMDVFGDHPKFKEKDDEESEWLMKSTKNCQETQGESNEKMDGKDIITPSDTECDSIVDDANAENIVCVLIEVANGIPLLRTWEKEGNEKIKSLCKLLLNHFYEGSGEMDEELKSNTDFQSSYLTDINRDGEHKDQWSVFTPQASRALSSSLLSPQCTSGCSTPSSVIMQSPVSQSECHISSSNSGVSNVVSTPIHNRAGQFSFPQTSTPPAHNQPSNIFSSGLSPFPATPAPLPKTFFDFSFPK